MESSRAKRQRMSSYYYVPLPDLPATFESLNDDSKRLILQFVGDKSYATYAGINKHCKEIYLTTKGMTKETFLYGYGSLSVIKKKYNNNRGFRVRKALGKGVLFYNRRDVLAWALQQQKTNILIGSLLKGICNVAAREERIDLLEEIFNGVEDWGEKECVFECVDDFAAKHGKLNVLKWVEIKELICTRKERCANIAAEKGHLHIIQWLYEKQGLKLGMGLYSKAIKYEHLHVLKWLREQACPWDERTFREAVKEGNLDILQWLHDEGCPWNESTFKYAAEKGNLNVLQWLHDEGCPWKRNFPLDETQLNTEVLDWLRLNGYRYLRY